MQTRINVLGTRWGPMFCGATERGVVLSGYPGQGGDPPASGSSRFEVYRKLTSGTDRGDEPGPGGVHRLVGNLVHDYLAGLPSDPAEAPVDFGFLGSCGYSGFAIRVYRACREIPRGETGSYADIARFAGHPGSHRAVGGALGNNPLALIVPCHRVVPTRGAPGGYAWGPGEKERLLDLEAGTS